MMNLKKYFQKSNKGPLLIIFVLLLLLYGYTISSFLASVPSEGFSREVEISRVTSGAQININSHIETIKLSDSETLIAAVDNHQYKLMTISRVGEVVNEKIVTLDLYNASDISASIESEGHLSIYYIDNDLYFVDVDLESLEFTKIKVAEDVDDFVKIENKIVFHQETGLYGMDINNHNQVLPLVLGPIKSYAIDKDDVSNTYHLVTTIKNVIAVDIRYIQFNENMDVVEEFLIRENTGSSYLKYISAISVEDNTLTAVYVWSDKKYGANNVTVQQYNTKTGDMFTDYRHEFSLHRSSYIITEVDRDTVKLLFQDDVHYGINIVDVTISKDSEPIIIPLTKTKKLSLLSKYFNFGEDQSLVFFDLYNGDKIIYFASSNADVIEKTTKATTIDPVRIIGLIFIVIFQAAFIGAVFYLFFVAFGPFLLLLVMNKFLPDFKNKIYIQSGISVILHIGLKLYLTYNLINIKNVYILSPPIVGEEPFIYIFLVVLSVISYLLMTRYIKWNIEYTSTPMLSYLHFIFFEYVGYILVIYIYITTYLVINKI